MSDTNETDTGDEEIPDEHVTDPIDPDEDEDN